MALDSLIVGYSGTVADVNASHQLKVVPEVNASANPGNVGSVKAFNENDDGSITGTPYLKSPETSADYRQRVGIDTVLKSYSFNGTAQDTANWKCLFATMTATQPGSGTLNLGTVQGTANGHGVAIQSFQYFPLIGTAPLWIEVTFGSFTAQMISNEVFACGLGIPTAAALPTDGVWLELTTGGLICRTRFNNSDNVSGVLCPLSDFTVGSTFKLSLMVGEEEIEIWRNDFLLGEVEIPVSNGQPFQTTALPVFAQKYCTGTVSNTNTMRISDITVSLADIGSNILWSHQMAMQGLSGYQLPPGGAIGGAQFIGTWTTGSTPQTATAAAGSNTTPAITTLGGLAAINAAAGAATDFDIMGWTNPAGGINQTPRTYILTGIKISTINLGAAVATTPTTILWTIGFGSTVATLNQAESASFANNTAKATRRVQIGYQSAPIGAVIGAKYDSDLFLDLTHGPICVNPGELLHLIAKIVVGTATASQTIHTCITPIGYFF